ncbi:hypothetical protein JXA32_17660 [Candidatus Sumerlaeota bacterium]|nr:hypothetical protein [Candidatus Sumerlaeota bacterium]
MGFILMQFGRAKGLLPEEMLAREQRRFRAVSSKSAPSYRIGCNLPPLWRLSLLVTDRRCLALADFFFHCMSQEVVMWYPGCNPEGDPETITGVSCESGLFGRCLELRSHNPLRQKQRWLWSPELTFRFFMKNPERIEAIIRQEMMQK